MPKTRHLLCIAGAAFVASTSEVARAEPADVERLIGQGVELRKAKKDQEALDKFREAHQKSGSPWALAQAALAEQALGKWVEADNHLRTALESKTHPWIAKRLAQLQTALTDIESHVGTLEITGNVDGAEVRINGLLQGKLPLPDVVKVVAGSVVVEVTAPDHWPLSRTLNVGGGGFLRERFELGKKAAPQVALPAPEVRPEPAKPALAATPVGAETEVSRSPLMKSLPWVVLGTGVATAGAGAFLRLGASKASSDLESSLHSRAEATDLLDRSKTWGTAGTVCLISGAVLAAAGAALLAVDLD